MLLWYIQQREYFKHEQCNQLWDYVSNNICHICGLNAVDLGVVWRHQHPERTLGMWTVPLTTCYTGNKHGYMYTEQSVVEDGDVKDKFHFLSKICNVKEYAKDDVQQLTSSNISFQPFSLCGGTESYTTIEWMSSSSKLSRKKHGIHE